MKKKTMIDTVFMPAIISSLMGLSGSLCYAEQQWSIQIEPMYMDVFGNDQHQANIVSTTTTTATTTTFSPIPPPIGTTSTTFTSTSTSTTESVDLDMEGDFALRGQIEFMPNYWGAGLSGWWFDTDDSFGRALNSGPTPPPVSFPPPPTITTTSVVYSSNNFFLTAPPSDSGSVLSVSAAGDLEVWNVDVYGIRTLAEMPNVRVNMTFGAKLGSIDKEVSEAGTQGPATTVFDGSSTSSFNRRVTSSADTDVLAGPSIGIQAYARHGRHRFEGLLSQSVLIGDVDREVVSETESFSSFSGLGFSSTSSFTSRVSFSDSETELIPITELKLKYLYDVTANLSLGVGVFASVWVDTPIPSVTPTGFFFAPTSFSEPPEDTLGFLGGMAALNYRF